VSKTIQEAFEQFHSENPQVYEELVALAREAHSNGATKLAIGMLWEVLRWRHKLYLRTEDRSQHLYGLNDHYRSRYARLIMDQERDLDGIFEVRRLRSHGPNPLYDSEGRLTLFA
jgi:hypothetical protein